MKDTLPGVKMTIFGLGILCCVIAICIEIWCWFTNENRVSKRKREEEYWKKIADYESDCMDYFESDI